MNPGGGHDPQRMVLVPGYVVCCIMCMSAPVHWVPCILMLGALTLFGAFIASCAGKGAVSRQDNFRRCWPYLRGYAAMWWFYASYA